MKLNVASVTNAEKKKSSLICNGDRRMLTHCWTTRTVSLTLFYTPWYYTQKYKVVGD